MSKTLIASLLAVLGAARINPANDSMIGTNVGGWMVLEPWITPSLFYRFLGKTHSEGIGTDCWTVCEALGPVEGNKLMRAHWDSFITAEVVQDLADREVEIVRLPIGDWTTHAYGPYIGCMDGAHDKIEWFMDECHKHGIKVLLDIHAIKGSQNGFDNSGNMSNVEWIDDTHFKHWTIQAANWMGDYNVDSGVYDNLKPENIDWSLDRVKELMMVFGQHPALYAFEPVNEPWWSTPLDVLFDYYRRSREIIKDINPDVLFVFHESFRADSKIWNELFADDDMKNVVLDTHPYMAWEKRNDDIQWYVDFYTAKIADLESIKYPVWAGEWAFATDACALWLDGINDSKTDPQHTCEWVQCPKTYLPDSVATDFDRTAATISPWGEHDRYMVQHGLCTNDSAFFSDEEVQYLADSMFKAFDKYTDANFIWTARNEIESKWSYVWAYDKGWMKTRKVEDFLQ